MPFYSFARRWRKKRLTKAAIARTAARMGQGYLSKGLLPTLASEAKRFITDLGDTAALGTLVNATNPFRQVLTTIPRNISGTDQNVQHRIGRKIFLKGVTLRVILTQTIAGGASGVRLILVQQRDPDEDLFPIGGGASDFHAPIAPTAAARVIMDRYVLLNALTSTDGGPANRIISKYVKVNKPMTFLGNANDGTDPSSNSLVLYNVTTDGNGHKIHGATTVHYRDYM